MTSKERVSFEDLTVKHKESVQGNCSNLKFTQIQVFMDDLKIKIRASCRAS